MPSAMAAAVKLTSGSPSQRVGRLDFEHVCRVGGGWRIGDARNHGRRTKTVTAVATGNKTNHDFRRAIQKYKHMVTTDKKIYANTYGLSS